MAQYNEMSNTLAMQPFESFCSIIDMENIHRIILRWQKFYLYKSIFKNGYMWKYLKY